MLINIHALFSINCLRQLNLSEAHKKKENLNTNNVMLYSCGKVFLSSSALEAPLSLEQSGYFGKKGFIVFSQILPDMAVAKLLFHADLR